MRHVCAQLMIYEFSEGAVKQGILFSEDEQKTHVDEQKTRGLLAPPKITLFQVDIKFQQLCFSLIMMLLYKTCFFSKEPETPDDQKSLSVAQMKAKSIIESFENPFRMVRKKKRTTPILMFYFNYTANYFSSF